MVGAIRRRPSVVAYLLTAFAVCLASIVGLTALMTKSSFDRERKRALSDLRAVAQQAARDAFSFEETGPFLSQMAGNPALAAMDATVCKTTFAGLEGLIMGFGRAFVLRPDGSAVCELGGNATDPPVVGPWLAEALASDELVTAPAALEPSSGKPAVLLAQQIPGPTGPVGVLATLLYVGNSPVEVPNRMEAETLAVVTDVAETLVLAASSNATELVGTPVVDGRPVVSGEYLWAEAEVPFWRWRAIAGLPHDVALASAQDELRRNLAIGGLTFLFVGVLGLLLHHRLARPMRRLGKAIEASLGGDEQARAEISGPAEVAHAAAVFNDLIAERQAREAALRWQAGHDSLTTLPNRSAVIEHLQATLATGDLDVGVVFLDLDRFKLVNDSHGHAVGDQVLVALGARLVETVQERGLVGRFGGDEFVAVFHQIGGEPGAIAMAARIAEALQSPLRVDGQEIWLAGSIGIALAKHGDVPEDLLRNADTAMYRAKENGRGGYALFDGGMRAWAILRLDIERDLHRALERGELSLHYQPKIDLVESGSVGVEALLRWTHPDRGMVPPVDFIPIAEETGLIIPIGAWVLQQAAKQAQTWRRAVGRAMPVAVNFSARQLADPNLADEVALILELAGAEAADIIVEITESAVLQDVDGASARLAALRAMGVRVSIDDFGTGYSSLSYLQRLPIDELKIDRSFVSRLGDRSAGAIVGSIVDLAHAIGLTVVAEGIETVDQLNVLRDLECDLGQGYLLARPQPSRDVSRLLELGISALDLPTRG